MCPSCVWCSGAKVDGVKLQALSGLILALSNGAGPGLLLPRLGTVGTVRAGMTRQVYLRRLR
jgi:hypothetical protein